MLRIGIDPAFRKDGFAYCSLDKDGLRFYTFKENLNFFAWVQELPKAKIAVENSNLTDTTFPRKGESMLVYGKRSRNVGKNQAMSQLAIDFLRSLGHTVIDVNVTKKGKKKDQKWVKMVAASYKWPFLNLPKNQDERDAFVCLLYTL